MAENKYLIPFILISILSIVLLAVILNDKSTEITCEELPSEEPLLTALYYNSFINLYNEDEYIYQLNIINYGYREAKNVKISCKTYNTDEIGNKLDEKEILLAVSDAGNIASTSSKFVEISVMGAKDEMKKWGNSEDWITPLCEIDSCEDCIILDNRINW